MAAKRAVLLIDHGSRSPASHDHLQAVAQRLAERSAQPVHIAHMEIASPSIADAITSIADEGFVEVFIIPLFFAPGRHATEDVPRLVEAACAKHPQLSVEWSPIFGASEAYNDALATLIESAPSG